MEAACRAPFLGAAERDQGGLHAELHTWGPQSMIQRGLHAELHMWGPQSVIQVGLHAELHAWGPQSVIQGGLRAALHTRGPHSVIQRGTACRAPYVGAAECDTRGLHAHVELHTWGLQSTDGSSFGKIMI